MTKLSLFKSSFNEQYISNKDFGLTRTHLIYLVGIIDTTLMYKSTLVTSEYLHEAASILGTEGMGGHPR